MRERMVDEMYKLDYKNLIGDMPTWFKYHAVHKNSYNVSTREILFTKDTSLNHFISLKRMVPITVPKNGKEEKGGGGKRESRILKVYNIFVCAVQDPKINLDIIATGGGGMVIGGETGGRW